MKRLSRNDIEDISKRVIDAYWKIPGAWDERSMRVDPELLATNLLGLNVDYAHLSLDGCTLGFTTFHEMGVEVYDCADNPFMYILDGKTILIESELKENVSKRGRCNFGIMHESGHQILKCCIRKNTVRHAKFIKIDTTGKTLGNYSDKSDVSDWEVADMAWLTSAGIYAPENNKLLPKAKAERQLVATMISGFAVKYVK